MNRTRFWLCANFLFMSMNSWADTASIDSLSFMVGSWKGALGDQTVEETWSAPNMGSMDTMIRLSNADGVQMIELIVIREAQTAEGENTLTLHLRQFSPTLELRTSREMQLKELGEQSASFVAKDSPFITQLEYKRLSSDHLRVEVTISTGNVLAADLHPN